MASIPKRLPRDVNARAVAIARILIEGGEDTDPRTLQTISTMKARASKGGHGRASSLNAERKREIARMAAKARWNRKSSE